MHFFVFCLLSATLCAQSPDEEGLSEAERVSNRGAKFAANGDFRLAAAAFRKAVGLDPTFTVAHYNLGLALLRQEDYEDAIHAFTSAVRLKPEYADAWFHMGLARMSLQEFEDAAIALTNALRFRPGNPAIRYRLGQALWKMERWKEVVDVWEALLFDSPGHPSIPRIHDGLPKAYYNLGTDRQVRGDAEGAAAAYGEALRLDPVSVPTLRNLGLLRREQGDHQEAIELFERGLEIDPDNASMTMALAVSCTAAQRFTHSDSLLNRLLSRGALVHDARVALAQNRIASGDVVGGLRHAQEAVRLRPNSVRSLLVLAFVHEHNAAGERYGDGYEEAAAMGVYEQALTIDPQSSTVHFNIGVLHAKARRWDEAREAFERTIALDSDHTGAKNGLEEIDRITGGAQLIRVR